MEFQDRKNSNTNPEAESLKIKIKNKANEWIASSTSHGLPRIISSNKLHLKIIWSIAFIISIVGCCYTVVKNLIDFSQYNVDIATNIEIETPIEFPAVTICNLNPFNPARANKFFEDTIFANNLNFLQNLTYIQSNITTISLAQIVTSVFKSEAATNPQYNTTYRKSLGFYLDEMVISCNYASSDCSSDDFLFYRSYDYGNCYTFNSGKYENGSDAKVKTISSSGPDFGNGLVLELFAGDPDDESYTYNRGFFIVVHNQSYTPIFDNGVHVSANTETNIGIDRTLYFKLSYPYSSCVKDTTSDSSSNSNLYKAIITQLGEINYRQLLCYKYCYQMSVIKTCACYDPKYKNPFPNFNDKAIGSCRGPEDVTCMIKTKIEFESKAISKQCSNECPIECDSITYSTSISTSTFPTDYYLKWMMLQTDISNRISNKSSIENKIKSSIAKVNVFYNNIAYTAYTESASTTWDSLLGTIGGQLGLFIGISLLSLIELVDFFIECLIIIFHHTKKNN